MGVAGGRCILALSMAASIAAFASARTGLAATWQDCWLPVPLTVGVSGELDLSAAKPANGESKVQDVLLRADQRLMIEPVAGNGDKLAKDQEVILAAAGGRLEQVPPGAVIRTAEGSFAVGENPALSAETGTSVRLITEVTAEKDGQSSYLPRGASGAITGPVTVRLEKPEAWHPWLAIPKDANFEESYVDIVEAEGLPSAEAARSLLVRLSKPGVNFQEKAQLLRACIQKGTENKPAAIESVVNISDGIADLQIRLPDFKSDNKSNELRVGLIVADGSFVGSDDFNVIGRWTALLAALSVLIVGHLLLTLLFGQPSSPENPPLPNNAPKPLVQRIRESKFSRDKIKHYGQSAWRAWLEIFSGPRGKPSLSSFQIYIWSWLVLISLIYVGIQTGDLLGITTEMLVLLGIAGAGSLSARFINTYTESVESPARDSLQFRDIIKTDGVLDLFKLQMFLFTILTWFWVGFRVIYDHTFPPLDPNLLLLLGISNGIYVGSKVAGGESPFRIAERANLDHSLLVDAKKVADADMKEREEKVAAKEEEIRKEQDKDKKALLDGELVLLRRKYENAKLAAKNLDDRIIVAKNARDAAMAKLSSPV